MLNFRQFEAGPDPFGRTWQVLFKWMQTAISIRHSDTVDVKFLLRSDDAQQEITIALRHPDLLQLSRATGHGLTDPWCSRLAAQHLKHIVETGEDLDKDLITLSPDQLAARAAELAREDRTVATAQ